MKKEKLLNESTVRKFLKLANVESTLAESFVSEKYQDLEEETLEEDNFDKTGKGSERDGAGKDGEMKGVASNMGQEPPDSPDGKLEIPGTSYEKDHKLSSKSVETKDIDGGKPLAENIAEMDVEDPEEEELLEAPVDDPVDEPSPEMDMEPSLDEPAPEMDSEVGSESEELLKKVVHAVAGVLGVDVSVDGDEGEASQGDLEEPEVDLPAEEVPPSDMSPDMADGTDALSGEEEEDVNPLQEASLEELMAEVDRRKALEEAEKAALEEKNDITNMVESITQKVAEKLLKR